jgi:hypothetical protein
MAIRHFNSEWQCKFFYSATRVEAMITGHRIETTWDIGE